MIMLIQGLVAVVAYAWVQSSMRALKRADRAEQIARLEHDLTVQAEKDARQKQVLEASIWQIVQTQIRVAKRDYSARVPLNQDNVLWQVSGSLNNLLARLQRLHQLELQYDRMIHQERSRQKEGNDTL